MDGSSAPRRARTVRSAISATSRSPTRSSRSSPPRLDSLDAEQRELLQDASVLGLSFTLTGLAAVAGSEVPELERRLQQLVRREFLVLNADPRSPERGQYGFVHRLIREVAYGTLAKRDRRARHLAAARYFETLGDEELTGILASHYLDAYRAAPEGDEGRAVAVQARVALRAAAERASALHSNALAFAYLEQALEVVQDPFERAELAERAGVAAAAAGRYDRADEYLAQAKDGFQTLGDEIATARATARIGERLLASQQVDRATTLLEEALRSLSERPPDAAVVTLQTRLANAYMRKGEQELAVEWCDRALAGAERLDMLLEIAEAMVTRGTALGVLGRTREGTATLEAARAFASEHDFIGPELRAHLNLSNLLWTTDPRKGLDIARRGSEMAERIGHRMWHVLLDNNAIACATRTGDWDWALEREAELRTLDLDIEDLVNFTDTPLIHISRGEDRSADVEQLREMHRGTSDQQGTATLGYIDSWAAFVRGETGRAIEIAERTVSSSNLFLPTGLLLIGRAAVAGRDLDTLLGTLRRLDEAGLHGRAIEAHRRTLQAGIAALEGRRGDAGIAYREAANQWRSLGLRFDLALTLLELVTHAATTEREREPAAAEAREIFVELRATPFIERLDGVLRQESGAAQVMAETAGAVPNRDSATP